jgi:predicted house-cleaning NTP pyrophosphatase (Maf/HAM1 superfamily)
MKIDRKKVAESIHMIYGEDLDWVCPVCGEGLYDIYLGCDTCYPLKCILHKGYGKDDKTYRINRFQLHGASTVIRTGLTLKQAQKHCRREDSHTDVWFDGYEEE